MIITNAKVFTDLVGTGNPELLFTTYDPTVHWNRPELLGARKGSLLIQVGEDGAECFGGEIVAIWYKRTDYAAVSSGGGQYDWALLHSLPVSGSTAPVASDSTLCALPVGSVYVQRTGTNCVAQLYVKAFNNCGAPSCADWYPLLLSVVRTGDEFSFDPATNTLTLPASGNLTDNGDGTYTWQPDDGGDSFDIAIPTLEYTEGDDYFTFDANDGTPATVVPLGTGSEEVPDDISGVERPWVKIGQTQATNEDEVLPADHIWHTGKMVRGAVSIGSTAADVELRGNVALGAGNHDMTGASNGFVGGDANIVKNTANGTVFGGTNNVIDGTSSPSTIKNDFIGGGSGNRVDAPNAAVVAGNSNDCGSNAGFIGAGQNNETGAGDGNAIVTGNGNTASGGYSFIGGGENNTVATTNGTIPGGRFNQANGLVSTAMGIKAKADNDYSIVFCTDHDGNPNAAGGEFTSTVDHQFAVKAIGGFRFVTNNAESAGMYMTGSSWVAISDRRLKTDLTEIDGDEVLEAFSDLQVYQFRYLGETRLDVGPVAQDFYHAFGDYVEQEQDANGYLAIADSAKIAMLMAAMSAAAAKIAELEQKVAELQNV